MRLTNSLEKAKGCGIYNSAEKLDLDLNGLEKFYDTKKNKHRKLGKRDKHPTIDLG